MRARIGVTVALMLLSSACGGTAGDAGSTPTITDSPTTQPTPTTEPTLTTGSGPLVGIGEVELVDDGGFLFTELEGPQWMPDEGVLLFSDIVADTIYQLGAADEITVFRKPSDSSNGLAVDPDGRLIAAESGTRRVTRTETDGTVTSIADRFEGSPLNQPNDIVVRSDGTIYFTDPAFGEADAQAELDFRGVFRIAPGGELTAEYRGETTEAPNGVAMSPDERLLYVTDFAAELVRVYDVARDGSLSEPTTFVTVAGPDGMAVDEAGNLFVASFLGRAIEVFGPDGEHLGTIPVPSGAPSNCAFGGADGRILYITTGRALYRVTLEDPGLF